MTLKYARSPEVDETSVGNQSILYHRRSGTAVVLNATGSLVWSFLAAPQTGESLAERIVQTFPRAEPERVLADVSAFLDESLGHGLIISEP
jgi:hypothetical protein